MYAFDSCIAWDTKIAVVEYKKKKKKKLFVSQIT